MKKKFKSPAESLIEFFANSPQEDSLEEHLISEKEYDERVEAFGMRVEGVNKAQSKSDGKPKYLDIFRWLDPDFLLEMVKAMKVPVEEIKKYPKDNWKLGKGDDLFIQDRGESSLRHLVKETLGEKVDKETGAAHQAHEAVNAMMRWYCDRL